MVPTSSLPPPPDPPLPIPQPSPKFIERRYGWLTSSAAFIGIVATLWFGLDPLFGIAAIFVLVVPFEKLFPRHRQKIRRPHLGTDIAYAITATPLGAVGLVLGVALVLISLTWLPGLALRPLVSLVPPLPRTLVGIALFDLAVYWTHRFGHEVPFLWRFHRIHHSTEHLDWVSGFRSHPLDGVLIAPAIGLLLAAGFEPELTGAMVLLQLLIGLFLHANVRWLLRPLHRLVITPEFHHWHHSNEVDARCSNYTVVLPFWDSLFGTYFMPRDRRPQVYGIDDSVSVGIVGQLWDPLRGLRNPLRMMRHPIDAGRDLVRMLRHGARQIVRSARRPRRSTMA